MDTTYWVRWHGLHILGPVLMLMCGFHVGEATTQSAGLAASIDWHMVDKFDIKAM